MVGGLGFTESLDRRAENTSHVQCSSLHQSPDQAAFYELVSNLNSKNEPMKQDLLLGMPCGIVAFCHSAMPGRLFMVGVWPVS